jgi:hypothetical protein
VRTFSVVLVVRLFRSSTRSSIIVFCDVLEVSTGFSLPSSHAHVTSDADSATLLGDSPTQYGTFCKSWELLRTENSEHSRFDLQSPVK